MNDFNNFFDDNKQQNREHTPIYHTPTPSPSTPPKKKNTAAIVCIVAAVIMCLALVVNVIVLATLKNSISAEYATKIAQMMEDEYNKAIQDKLDKEGIVDDIINNATNDALDKIKVSISELAADNCLDSTAIIKCSNGNVTGTATGFLISNTDTENGITSRYMATNAHVVKYEREKPTGGFGQSAYEFAFFSKITAMFENDTTIYNLSIVSVGDYSGEHIKNVPTLPDLAILAFVGAQPDETKHPSLKIAKTDYAKLGCDVALIGNPAGYGLSISSGAISNCAKPNPSWGAGKFIMTDAAVNPGNSGGPMINRQLAVVGVVEYKIVNAQIDNMGFAVSAETLVDFINWSKKSANNRANQNIEIPITLALVSDPYINIAAKK